VGAPAAELPVTLALALSTERRLLRPTIALKQRNVPQQPAPNVDLLRHADAGYGAFSDELGHLCFVPVYTVYTVAFSCVYTVTVTVALSGQSKAR
jgi:hypothetical protein